jgi:hypothetical protein
MRILPQGRMTMKMFEVQGIEIQASRNQVFEFVRQPGNLPKWARAFVAVDDDRARLETPSGAIDITLKTSANADAGSVDWRLEFPDGGIGIAHSRVTETTRGTSIYSFVLHAPPVALEAIEGALHAQSATLRTELATLKSLLEDR